MEDVREFVLLYSFIGFMMNLHWFTAFLRFPLLGLKQLHSFHSTTDNILMDIG